MRRLSRWKTSATSRSPVRRKLPLVEPPERATEHPHLAGRRLVEPGRELQHRRLPAPGRSEHGEERAGLDPQVEPAQGHGLDRSRAVDLEDVVQLERAPDDLDRLLRLSVEAPQRHRKLSAIRRNASTLSTPRGVASSMTATRPPCER